MSIFVADKSKTVYTEEGYIFEDWVSDNHNGIRMRNDITWEEGWAIYTQVYSLGI